MTASQYTVPENIHTTPQKGLEFPEGWHGGSVKPKTLIKEMYEA